MIIRKSPLLIVVLALILLLLVGFSLRPAEPDPVGTFCDGEQVSPDSRYLTLQTDGSYLLYRQFERLEEGSWEAAQEEDSLLLTLRAADGSIREAALTKSEILRLGEQEFRRISDTPTYINVKP